MKPIIGVHNGVKLAILSFVFFFPSYAIVYAINWIVNLFKPIPNGVDMYRDSVNLALDTFPNTHIVTIVSIIVGICCGVFATFLCKFKNDKVTTIITLERDNPGNADCTLCSTNEKHRSLEKNSVENDWYDHSLEDHDSEDGWCTECEEFEEDLE